MFRDLYNYIGVKLYVLQICSIKSLAAQDSGPLLDHPGSILAATGPVSGWYLPFVLCC